MRKILLSLILISLFMPLYAEAYKSNALGQKLENIEVLSGIGWEREDKEHESILYKDNVVIRTRNIFEDGFLDVEGERKERVFIDDRERVVRRIIEELEYKEEYNYFYDDKAMLGYTYSLNSELKRKVDYILAGNKAVGFSSDDSALFSDFAIVYDIDGNVVKADTSKLLSSSKINPPQFEEDKLVQENNGIVYAYDGNGRLVEEREGNKYTFYTYSEDGALISKRVLEGDISIVEEYKDSNLILTTYYENRVIIKTRRKLGNGEIEEIRYVSGTPSYRMIFDLDGRRLKEVSRI